MLGVSNWLPLYPHPQMTESAMDTSLGVANTFQQVREFVNTESADIEDPLSFLLVFLIHWRVSSLVYLCFCCLFVHHVTASTWQTAWHRVGSP